MTGEQLENGVFFGHDLPPVKKSNRLINPVFESTSSSLPPNQLSRPWLDYLIRASIVVLVMVGLTVPLVTLITLKNIDVKLSKDTKWRRNDFWAISEQASTILVLPALLSVFAVIFLQVMRYLFRYVSAKALLDDTDTLTNRKHGRLTLPTAYDIAVLLELSYGDYFKIFDAFKQTLVPGARPFGRLARHKRYIRHAVYLNFLLAVIIIMIIGSALAIFATAKSGYAQKPSPERVHLFGRDIIDSCYTSNVSTIYNSTNLNEPHCGTRPDLSSPQNESWMTSMNKSSENRITMLGAGHGLSPVAILTDPALDKEHLSFMSQAIGISSSCLSVSRKCWESAKSNHQGSCVVPRIRENTTSEIDLLTDFNNEADKISSLRRWGFFIHTKPPMNITQQFAPFNLAYNSSLAHRDGETGENSLILVFACWSFVYNVTYEYFPSYEPRLKYQAVEQTLVDQSVRDILLKPMFDGEGSGRENLFKSVLMNNVLQDLHANNVKGLDRISRKDPPVELFAQSLATRFSMMAIASVAGVAKPIPITQPLDVITILYIMKIPYYILCGSALAYALLALALGIYAFVVCWDKTQGVAEVHARLSIIGIAATAFSPHYLRSATNMKNLFEQDSERVHFWKRIKLVRTKQGGWGWMGINRYEEFSIVLEDDNSGKSSRF
ncbi:hypothetical protein M501DRAFT_1003292 [Patellaria atrata CBS 101060]|uniref:Uncharacterized protein n=1 Tax=Patellaria atrata CBS 101060 TaxID=1346257 RepID=A0A9P4SDI3_9PEZI|nr:hypothetical protein M501DRAFT_1003292 [Patellaria atrata CBS 101060]